MYVYFIYTLLMCWGKTQILGCPHYTMESQCDDSMIIPMKGIPYANGPVSGLKLSKAE